MGDSLVYTAPAPEKFALFFTKFGVYTEFGIEPFPFHEKFLLTIRPYRYKMRLSLSLSSGERE